MTEQARIITVEQLREYQNALERLQKIEAVVKVKDKTTPIEMIRFVMEIMKGENK